MAEPRYTSDHEYIRVENGIGTIGISQYAQDKLGDIVFVELPAVGKVLSKGQEAAVVESVKAASEVYAPVSGEVVEVNEAIVANPELVNQDPEGNAWFLKIRIANPRELDQLMPEQAYKDYLETVE
ncbi:MULTISPECIES: glycine cleavage system protein GcvH [Rhodomicrobium]|uniref:glycine cleavage system protein GcvH n=1 Tax=Rhodomicrobium TaxID=1068 RepID=UPI000B4BA505|nr:MULTISPECIES: glycine cleavage system protein GcvH [Rhodomicrobium]